MIWVEALKALAWPITIIILFLFCRDIFRGLIPRISTLKYGDFELEISKQLGNIDAEFNGSQTSSSATLTISDLSELQSDPRAVFASKWGELEALIEAKVSNDLGQKVESDVLTNLGRLHAKGLISDKFVRAFNTIFQIKNILLYGDLKDEKERFRNIFDSIVIIEKLKSTLNESVD